MKFCVFGFRDGIVFYFGYYKRCGNECMGIGCILVAYMQKGRVFGFILASKKKIFLKCIGLSETSLKHGKLSGSISRMDTLDV